jgi:import inner membrane translocase subunit TIM44
MTVPPGRPQDSYVLDVSQLDLAQARITDQGPVLVITFTAQQVSCVRARSDNRVVEGDPDKVLRVTHVWALCRDMAELEPRAAWRVLEMAQLPTEQWL